LPSGDQICNVVAAGIPAVIGDNSVRRSDPPSELRIGFQGVGGNGGIDLLESGVDGEIIISARRFWNEQ
jgi:hypothetical protein